jgi:hypothetical protein
MKWPRLQSPHPSTVCSAFGAEAAGVFDADGNAAALGLFGIAILFFLSLFIAHPHRAAA